jgi:cation diffusion facilitator CzcD-associated flavoprotein CzcO
MIFGRNLVVENLATGETFKDDADVVVTARGTLNEPKWPKLPGMKDFKGETMHSAGWNDK